VKRPQDASNTENQAAAWLVRLDADTSAETLRHWRRWLGEDVRRRAAFVRLEEVWRQTDRLKSLKPLDSTVNPNVLDTFPGVTSTVSGLAPTPARLRSRASYQDLVLQSLAVALAAGMLAGKLVLGCWLFINPG
jgi:ferric-dicitrate binding protein FerR (iron transport regulator)